MASLIRELAKNSEMKIKAKDAYLSPENYLLFGSSGGKSSIVAALGDLTDDPVLILSPSGGSSHLVKEYKNIIAYPVTNLVELENIVTDLERNMELIKKLQFQIIMDNQAGVDALKTQFIKESPKSGLEDFEYCLTLAKENRFPISAVALEELDIVSSWIQDRVEEQFKIDVLGEDKKNLSADWSELRKSLMNFYTRILKLPIKTIFCTSDKLPKENQTIDKIMPNISVGQAARLLIGMIGNIFYVYSDGEKYFVRFVQNKTTFAKQKFKPIKNQIQIEEFIEVTGNPGNLWKYIVEVQTKEAKTIIKQDEKISNKK